MTVNGFENAAAVAFHQRSIAITTGEGEGGRERVGGEAKREKEGGRESFFSQVQGGTAYQRPIDPHKRARVEEVGRSTGLVLRWSEMEVDVM